MEAWKELSAADRGESKVLDFANVAAGSRGVRRATPEDDARETRNRPLSRAVTNCVGVHGREGRL